MKPADNDQPDDQYEMGQFYDDAALNSESGDLGLHEVGYEGAQGINIDFEQAHRWYLKSAKGGNVDAQYRVAEMFDLGQGVNRDLKSAAFWYLKAAEQNHPDAFWRLGEMFLDGQGVPKDLIQSIKWFSKDANDENSYSRKKLNEIVADVAQKVSCGNPEAQYIMGWMLLEGKGMGQNNTEAIEYLKMAAMNGSVKAQTKLGTMFHQEDGIAKE